MTFRQFGKGFWDQAESDLGSGSCHWLVASPWGKHSFLRPSSLHNGNVIVSLWHREDSLPCSAVHEICLAWGTEEVFIILSLSSQPYSCRNSSGANFVVALLRKMADSKSARLYSWWMLYYTKKDLCVCPWAYTGTHMYTHELSLFKCGWGTRLRALGLVADAFTHGAESSSWAHSELL